MEELEIALLNASFNGEDTRRNFERVLDTKLVEFYCPEGELPEPDVFDGYVITGSAASVYWEEPWIKDLRGRVEDIIETRYPLLGICFGYQLVADALGGDVERMEEYEIGYRMIEQHDESPLLKGIGRSFTSFCTHSDRVSCIPKDVKILAENEYGIQGLQKRHVYGVQFHPEFDIETARSVTIAREEDLKETSFQQEMDEITHDAYRTAQEATQIFDNFLAIVRDQITTE